MDFRVKKISEYLWNIYFYIPFISIWNTFFIIHYKIIEYEKGGFCKNEKKINKRFNDNFGEKYELINNVWLGEIPENEFV